jgi:hypothetical protein
MTNLIHEMWREDDGTCIGLMGCLAGPMGDQARSMLHPGAILIHVYEAGSIFEAGVIRYRLLDFGTYYSEWEDLDSQPYSDEWVEIQRAARAGTSDAKLTLTAKEQSDIIRQIGRSTSGGFETGSQALAGALDFIEPRSWAPEDRLWVQAELDRHWRGKLELQAMWPATPDWDRLDAVFRLLDADGILCLHNAGYTLSQGEEDVGAAWRERGGRQASGRTGYCFYHGQDVEGVVCNGTLALAYGRLSDDTAATLGAARRIVDALLAAGFKTAMPPDADTRIVLTGLVWRKRSPDD